MRFNTSRPWTGWYKSKTPIWFLLLESVLVDQNGCWIWMGGGNADGYGMVRVDRNWIGVHRLSYLTFKSTIPLGFVIDHLCRVPRCCNPDHLEAVTTRENAIRGVSPIAKNNKKTHCIKGHELSGANLMMVGKNKAERACITCKRAASRLLYRRNKIRKSRCSA